MHEKAKPLSDQGAESHRSIADLEFVFSVLASESGRIEGWTDECIFTRIVLGSFLFLVKKEEVMISTNSPSSHKLYKSYEENSIYFITHNQDDFNSPFPAFSL